MVFLSACATNHSAQRDKDLDYYSNLLQQATGYVFTLQEAGQLPGVGKDEHGNLELHSETLWDASGHLLKQRITFPITFNAYLTPDQRATEYRYKVSKTSKDAGWQLDGAWEKTKEGEFLEVK
jgi:hypothetical protein